MRWQTPEFRLAEKITDQLDRGSFDIDTLVLALVDSYSNSAPALIQLCEQVIVNTALKADSVELWRLPTEVGEAYARAQAMRDLLTSAD